MLTTIQNDIIDTLNSVGWLTAGELRSRIGRKRNGAKRFNPLVRFVGNYYPWLALVLSDRTPAVADILINLEILEEKGYVTCRDRENPESVLNRRGVRCGHEWHLA